MKVWWNIFLEKYRTWNKQEQYLILSGSTWSFSFNKLKIFFFFWKSFKMVLSRGHMCIRSDDQLWYYQMSVRSDWRPLSPRLPQNQACRSKVSTGLRWDPLTQSVWWTQQHRTSDHKQMELQRNGNLQTICMTRCSFSIIALSTAITTLAKPAVPFQWV